MRVIVIANQKGGIGKSTAVLNIGRALTERRYRVLLIDLDPQGGLSASVGIDSYRTHHNTTLLLTQPDISLGRVIQNIGTRFAIVPSNINLASTEVDLSNQTAPVSRLRQVLERHRPVADFVIIDTPPTLGILTANALIAAQELIIPVQCQFLAMRGVRAMLDTMKSIQKSHNPTLKLLGVLATLHQPDILHSQEALEEMRSVFDRVMFKTVLAFADVVAEAPLAAKSVLDYVPKHPAAHAYRLLAQEILQRGEQVKL